MSYSSFHPGEPWYDTEGKLIQAHGGSIIVDNGVYYWYGENKDHTRPGSDVWTWGVRMYRSEDLYNWKDLGLIIEPELDDPSSSLNPYTAMMDRPHILYNKHTKKYVCWMKVMRKDNTQTETVAVADRLTGPYTIVKRDLRPLSMDAGDFDMYAAPDSKGYYMFERVHSETIVADLTPDYTDVTGFYSEHFPHDYPPYVREATAYFTRDHKHYLLTSGTTGYFPNPSELAVSDRIHGPYKVLGNPHPSDPTDTSFHTQVSSVFKLPGKDLYIAIADRWAWDCMDIPYDYYKELFEKMFSSDPGNPADLSDLLEKYPLTEDQKKRMNEVGEMTAGARYVWLPLIFDDSGAAVIEWKDEWKWEDYV